jgi:hypothetical protein
VHDWNIVFLGLETFRHQFTSRFDGRVHDHRNFSGCWDCASEPYHKTPLDFVGRNEWSSSLYWWNWMNLLRRLHVVFAPKHRPVNRISNNNFPEVSSWMLLILFNFPSNIRRSQPLRLEFHLSLSDRARLMAFVDLYRYRSCQPHIDCRLACLWHPSNLETASGRVARTLSHVEREPAPLVDRRFTIVKVATEVW